MTVDLRHGDCREVIKTLAEASIHAVVTDPPYSLVSIQKRFGKPGQAPAQHGTDGLYRRASAGFMGQQWDTGETAHDPAFWAEVYRVLKPGAHLVAFGGTRTYHRMVCAIEDAGFEIRDQLGWAYGSGFPKSHNVGKAIDKTAGATRETIRERYTVKRIKPGATVVREGAWGKQDISYTATDSLPVTDAARQWDGWGTALKPAWEPICLARKPLSGTVAETVLQHGTGAVNIDGCRIHGEDAHGVEYTVKRLKPGATLDKTGGNWRPEEGIEYHGEMKPGRWPANLVHDGSEEVLAAFPDTGATRGIKGGTSPNPMSWGNHRADGNEVSGYSDDGSAARFFYSAKADADDRCDSKHPTVKPVALMRWLVRLITPPNGLVLDPFAGSGTTGVACLREGFDSILIEREDQYVKDIRHRLAKLSGFDTPLLAAAAT